MMSSESSNNNTRTLFRGVIGTILFASAFVLYLLTQPRIKFLDGITRASHGTECSNLKTTEARKFYADLVPQDVQFNTTNESQDNKFAMLVQKAATDDKIVIITEVNEAFAAPNSMLDLFLESFHNGENIEFFLDHLIIVAMDEKAFERCNSVHRYCYLHEQLGSDINSEKVYLTKGYIDIVWSKVRLWKFILEQGYSFFFTDVDAMWFRNPFRQISIYADLTLATDIFRGNPEEHNHNPNTGLVFAKPTKKNIEVLNYWLEARDRFPPTNEQTVYDKIKYELSSKFQLKIQYVSTAYWGNFCQPQKNFTRLSTFHACCLQGLATKLQNIKSVVEEWKKYKSQDLKN